MGNFFYHKGREGFTKDHKVLALDFPFSGRILWTIRGMLVKIQQIIERSVKISVFIHENLWATFSFYHKCREGFTKGHTQYHHSKPAKEISIYSEIIRLFYSHHVHVLDPIHL